MIDDGTTCDEPAGWGGAFDGAGPVVVPGGGAAAVVEGLGAEGPVVTAPVGAGAGGAGALPGGGAGAFDGGGTWIWPSEIWLMGTTVGSGMAAQGVV